MQITATEHLTEIEGVPVRLWNGVTEAGTPCLVFVHRVPEAELQRQLPPGVQIGLRQIL